MARELTAISPREVLIYMEIDQYLAVCIWVIVTDKKRKRGIESEEDKEVLTKYLAL